MNIVIIVRGVPVPQGSLVRSPSGGLYHGGGSRLALWRGSVRGEAQEAMGDRPPFAGPLAVVIGATFPRPKSHYRTGRHAAELRAEAPTCHAQVPDADKIARAILDALAGVAFGDDRQVSRLSVAKIWDETPGVTIRIEELEP